MNYFKIGILAFVLVFSATLSFAQSESESAPTLYGDKGGPSPEPVSEEESVSEPVTEEMVEPVPELTSEEEVETVSMSEEENESNKWYWAIAVLTIAGGALWLGMRRKTDAMGS